MKGWKIKMNETLQRIIDLKLETDSLIAKLEADSRKKAEKIRIQRTEALLKMVDDLCCLYQIAKEFKLTEDGGFYRLKTPIKSVVYPGFELEVILYNNCPHHFKISARKQNGNLISWMGYSEEWTLSKEKGFPLSMGEKSSYCTEVLNLLEEWKNAYQMIEAGLLSDCNVIIQRKLEYANILL